jgi:hypothetical protein
MSVRLIIKKKEKTSSKKPLVTPWWGRSSSKFESRAGLLGHQCAIPMRYSNPFSDSTNIQIRFIRKAEETDNPEKDDKIAIHHKGENVYHLYYQDGDTQNSKGNIAHMTVLEGEELDTYLLNLFTLLALDRQPFRSIQFLIPGCPTMLFLISDLRRKVIRRRIMNLMPLMHSVSKTHV